MEIHISRDGIKTRFVFRIRKTFMELYTTNQKVSIERGLSRRYVFKVISEEGRVELYLYMRRKPKIYGDLPIAKDLKEKLESL